ncbi:MAG: putative metallopeptidase [Pirellulales bacterium]
MSRIDFTQRMRHLCEDMVARLPELAHIRLSEVAMSMARARNRSTYGYYASLTPLRFQNGRTETVRRGREYRMQRVLDSEGREMLYILTFYLPRFMDLDLREKLLTVVHELWHISPKFDGDIRRHEGRCYAHTGSQAKYDEAMGVLADRWLAMTPPTDLYDFLHHNFDDLSRRHHPIVGTRYPRPRLLPVRRP